MSGRADSSLSVAIVGAGLSGMTMGLRLQQEGIPFTIFEKGAEVGGTWRENRYPGLTIDVPSPIYTFRGQRRAGWRRFMPEGREILSYFSDVATRTGLRAHIRFNTAVTAASWNGRAWEVSTSDGSTAQFRVLVCASGFLHHPRWPRIDGLETFAGELVHSAQWRDEIVTEVRRVGVIGNGSTGVQLVGALGGVASQLTLFQRTAQWIFPAVNFSVPPAVAGWLDRSPRLLDLSAEVVARAGDALLGAATIRPGWRRRAMEGVVRLHLRTVRDPALRAMLTPTDAPLCKRPVLSLRFYRAVQRPDVSVVVDPIERIDPEGVVTADGRLHKLDVLILATGFDAHRYMRPIAITGLDGVSLEDAWSRGPYGYRTMAIPRFPNLFMIMGPHSPLVSISIHESAELQSDYVVQMLSVLAGKGVNAVSPTEEATRRWLRLVSDGMPGTVWSSGCSSWYLGSGEVPVLWPYDRRSWRSVLRTPELNDYEIEAVRPPVLRAAAPSERSVTST